MVEVVSLTEIIELSKEKDNPFSFESVKAKITDKLQKELRKFDKFEKLSDSEVQNIRLTNKRTGQRKSYKSTLIKTTSKGSFIPLRYGTITVCGAKCDVELTDRENIEDTIRCLEEGLFDSIIDEFIKNDKKFLALKNRDYSALKNKKKNS